MQIQTLTSANNVGVAMSVAPGRYFVDAEVTVGGTFGGGNVTWKWARTSTGIFKTIGSGSTPLTGPGGVETTSFEVGCGYLQPTLNSSVGASVSVGFDLVKALV